LNITSLNYQKSVENTDFFISQSSENYITNSDLNQSADTSTDAAIISEKARVLNELGLDLKDSNKIISTNFIKYNYNFSYESLQVQAGGNYNYYSKEGSLNIQIDFGDSQKIENNKYAVAKNIKLKLNFTIIEKEIKVEKEKSTKSPDMLSIIMKIIKNVVDLTKDGQDKDIGLAFEDFKTFLSFMTFSHEKIGRLLLQWLFMISHMHNINDEDGRRDKYIILIRDKDIDFTYNKRELTIKMSNIKIEYTLPKNTTNSTVNEALPDDSVKDNQTKTSTQSATVDQSA
jgi:hypothetical protein